MAILEEKTNTQLLEQLEGNSTHEKWESCHNEHPWYPLPWLMTAKTDAEKQKAALWFKNEHRINWLLNKDAFAEDSWLRKQLHESNSFSEKATIELGSKFHQIAENNDFQPFIEESTKGITESPKEETEGSVFESENESSPLIAEEEAFRLESKTENSEAIMDDLALASVSEQEIQELPIDSVSDQNAAVDETDSNKQETTSIKEETDEKLAFEPLFTTDYFASQGIKIDPRAVPQTKLDRQLKTFTQWLKTMKRIGPETTLPADPMVDAQASASVVEKEVVTEAMVEVLEKQGKYQKAIETLGKLILLHPEKSAFFAAHIEKLKAKQ